MDCLANLNFQQPADISDVYTNCPSLISAKLQFYTELDQNRFSGSNFNFYFRGQWLDFLIGLTADAK